MRPPGPGTEAPRGLWAQRSSLGQKRPLLPPPSQATAKGRPEGGADFWGLWAVLELTTWHHALFLPPGTAAGDCGRARQVLCQEPSGGDQLPKRQRGEERAGSQFWLGSCLSCPRDSALWGRAPSWELHCLPRSNNRQLKRSSLSALLAYFYLYLTVLCYLRSVPLAFPTRTQMPKAAYRAT